jgi:hypothetical protein
MRPELYQAAYAGFSDATGNPLSGGRVYTYDAGTTTPRTTWQDQAKAVTNANPVVLDSSGRAEIWADGNYKFDLRNSANVAVDVIDGVFLGRDDGSSLHGGTSSGAANTYAITLSPPLTEYQTGQIVTFVSHFTNTSTAVTANINGRGSRTVSLQGLSSIYLGAIQNGGVYRLLVTATGLTLLNPHTGVQTYTPTLSRVSGGTLSSIVHDASYTFNGPIISVRLFEQFEVVTSAIPAVRCTLPVAVVGGTSQLYGGLAVNLGAGGRSGWYGAIDSTTIEVSGFDASSFTTGTGRFFGATVHYRWV